MQDMKGLRKLVIWFVVSSFSIAALMGIVALLGGGSFGDTEAKILLTTVIVGVESIAILCYLAVAGGRSAIVGILGGLVSLVPFGIALALTWGGYDGAEALWEVFGVSVTVAASTAQACLLLAMRGRRLGWLLSSTLVTIAIVAAMISLAIVDGADLGDGFWRAFGVVAILDVLGTVIIAAMKAFGRDKQPEGEPALLTTAVESRIATAAQERGMSPTALITEALDSFLK